MLCHVFCKSWYDDVCLDFVLELEEDLDLIVPPCSAVQEVGVLPGDGVDSLLVDDDDAMVP